MGKFTNVLMAGALAMLAFSSCSEEKKGYVIEGQVADVKEGMMYLKKYVDKTFIEVDSAVILDGSFDIISYIVKEGTEVICAEAFHDFPNSSSLQSIVVFKGKKEYFESILEEEYHHLLKEVV